MGQKIKRVTEKKSRRAETTKWKTISKTGRERRGTKTSVSPVRKKTTVFYGPVLGTCDVMSCFSVVGSCAGYMKSMIVLPLTSVPVSLQSQARLPPGQTLQSLYLEEHPFTFMLPQEREAISGEDMAATHRLLKDKWATPR